MDNGAAKPATDLRFMLKGGIVQIWSNADLGPDELDRLLTLIAAQRDALREAETAGAEHAGTAR